VDSDATVLDDIFEAGSIAKHTRTTVVRDEHDLRCDANTWPDADEVWL
jgi:hypothetical protein